MCHLQDLVDDPEESSETDSSTTLVAPLASPTSDAAPLACSNKQQSLLSSYLGGASALESSPVPGGTSKQPELMLGRNPGRAAVQQSTKVCWHQGDASGRRDALCSQEQTPLADTSAQQDDIHLQGQHSCLVFSDEGADPESAQSGSFDQPPVERQTRGQQASMHQLHSDGTSQEGPDQREPSHPQASNGNPTGIADALSKKQFSPCEAASGSRLATGTSLKTKATQQAVRSSKADGKALVQGHRAAASVQGGLGGLRRPASQATQLSKSHRSPERPASAAQVPGPVKGLHQEKPLQTGRPAPDACKGLHREKALQTGKRPLKHHSVKRPTGSAAASHHMGILGPEYLPAASAMSLAAAKPAQTDASCEPGVALQEGPVASSRAATASSQSCAALNEGVAGGQRVAAANTRTSVRAAAASLETAPASPRVPAAVPRANAGSPKAATPSPKSPRSVSAHQAAAGSRLPFVSTTRSGQPSQPSSAHLSSPRSPMPAALPAKRRRTVFSASQPKSKSVKEHGHKALPADQSQPVLLLNNLNSAVQNESQPLSQTDDAGENAHQKAGLRLHAQHLFGDEDVSNGQAAQQQNVGQSKLMQGRRAPATKALQSTAVFGGSEYSSDMADRHTQLATTHTAHSPELVSPLQLQLQFVGGRSSDGESDSESQHSSGSDGSSTSLSGHERLNAEAHKGASSAWDHFGQHPDSVGKVAELFMMHMRAKLVFQVSAAVWLAFGVRLAQAIIEGCCSNTCSNTSEACQLCTSHAALKHAQVQASGACHGM